MGRAGGVGVEWEGRMGAVSRGCWALGPPGQAPSLLGFWWVVDSQAFA